MASAVVSGLVRERSVSAARGPTLRRVGNAAARPVFRGAGGRRANGPRTAVQIDSLRNTNDGMLRITNMIRRHLPGT